MKSSDVCVLSCSAFRGSDRFTATVSIRQTQLSRVEMNALRALLTALPVPKGIFRLFA
jgi:hypothetical protein